MTQLDLGPNLSTKHMRKRELLDELMRVVPWSRIIALIEPYYPKGASWTAVQQPGMRTVAAKTEDQ